jgi:hypothetical protein
MYWQPDGSEVIEVAELGNPLARALHDFIAGPAATYATYRESRRFKHMDLVSFDLAIERPQRPVYDIRAVESVTVCFPTAGPKAFSVVVARPDFPDTPHQNLVAEGFPCCICVDDRPWQDTKSFYTAAELMGRISSWFEKACQGELHGAEQPMDPLFVPTTLTQIVLKCDFWKAVEEHRSMFIWTADPENRFLFISGVRPAHLVGDDIRLMAIYCEVKPQQMVRMKRAPRDLGQLCDFLTNAGVDFTAVLHHEIKNWVDGKREHGDGKRITCFIVKMPKIDPATSDVRGFETVAFVSPVSPGQIGEKMGFLYGNSSNEANGVNFVHTLGGKISIDAARDIPVVMAFVHHELDARQAAMLSGKDNADDRRILMIGAGSAGSAISETLVRQGLFKWTIVDDDTMLPHNIARHSLNNIFVGENKAHGLANRLSNVRQDADVQIIPQNVLFPSDQKILDDHIADAELILDASASVPVSRWVSDLPGGARRICAFFTPDGKSGILMMEDQARAISLRDLEAAYLREVLLNPALANHLGTVSTMLYTGACRALTNRVPMSSIQTLSGLISAEIASGTQGSDAVLKIWTMVDNGINVISVDAKTCRTTGEGWSVSMPTSFVGELVQRRNVALPNETGGPLLGMMDFERRRIDIVGTLPPPNDSISTPSSFTRGVSGLRKGIEAAAERTGNQIRYIGEWHSHPKGFSSRPSITDCEQIKDLGEAMKIDGLPAISVIVAEEGTTVLIGGSMVTVNG